jgi:hypothetical protein
VVSSFALKGGQEMFLGMSDNRSLCKNFTHLTPEGVLRVVTVSFRKYEIDENAL